jgi:SP family myo-inositol transporter-like MFS transporter 13
LDLVLYPIGRNQWAAIWLLVSQLSSVLRVILLTRSFQNIADDTASISSALLYLAPSLSTPDHPVTTWDKSIITSATSFGALIGGLVAGIAADRWGRRVVIWIADWLFVAGALWQAFSFSVNGIISGRFVVGLGVGIGSLVVPLYISELAPPSHRGRLVVISVLFITFGQLVAYTIGLLLSPPSLPQDTSWRLILGLGALPAVLQAALMILMPETPRWQLLQGRTAAAADTISQVYGTEDTSVISSILLDIDRGIPKGPPDPFLATLKNLVVVRGNLRALIIACSLQFLQQACGFNSLMYFSPTIFSMIGFTSPTAVALLVAGTNALFTAAAFILIDRIGRRKMLLLSLVGMTASLLLTCVGFLGLPSPLPSTPLGNMPIVPAATVVVAIVFFVAAYATGLGTIPWLCQSEFFPISVRGVGTGVATATNWGWNLIVASSFLILIEQMGGSTAFLIYAAVCAIGWALCWMIYPETGGLGMEEIEAVLRKGWGVQRSLPEQAS